MKNKINAMLVPLLILTGCASQVEQKTIPANESVVTMIQILQQGRGKDICPPPGSTLGKIAIDLNEYTKEVYKNGILTTPQMKMAFKKLYPC